MALARKGIRDEMLKIKRAPAGLAGTDGAETQKTLASGSCHILSKPATNGNSPHQGRVLDARYLAELLRAFDVYHGLRFEDPGYPLLETTEMWCLETET